MRLWSLAQKKYVVIVLYGTTSTKFLFSDRLHYFTEWDKNRAKTQNNISSNPFRSYMHFILPFLLSLLNNILNNIQHSAFTEKKKKITDKTKKLRTVLLPVAQIKDGMSHEFCQIYRFIWFFSFTLVERKKIW